MLNNKSEDLKQCSCSNLKSANYHSRLFWLLNFHFWQINLSRYLPPQRFLSFELIKWSLRILFWRHFILDMKWAQHPLDRKCLYTVQVNLVEWVTDTQRTWIGAILLTVSGRHSPNSMRISSPLWYQALKKHFLPWIWKSKEVRQDRSMMIETVFQLVIGVRKKQALEAINFL